MFDPRPVEAEPSSIKEFVPMHIVYGPPASATGGSADDVTATGHVTLEALPFVSVTVSWML